MAGWGSKAAGGAPAPTVVTSTKRHITDVSTIEPMLQPGPLHWGQWPGPPTPPDRRPRRRYRAVLAGVALVLAAAFLASGFVTLPYYAIAPGSAQRVDNLVQVSDASKAFPPKGKVLFTTVSLYRIKPLDLVHSWLDRDIDVVPEKQILGGAKPQDLGKIDLQEMTDSKQIAVAVALRRLGAKEEGKGTLVLDVGKGAAASGHLKAGDVITSVDGKPTPIEQDAVAAIRAHHPGDHGKLDVVSPGGGPSRTEDVVFARNPETGVAFLGVNLATKDHRFNLPYTVTIDSGRVGGPSAGLAFTLEVLDLLTPGELTGGRQVAVTGTIEPDGSVGEVGGVTQKTAAVRAAGARYFLVPTKEAAQARARAGRNLTVLPVANLADAVAALHSLGGETAVLGSPPPS